MQASETVDGSGPIWLNSVTCTDTNTRITGCRLSNYGGHTCSHSEDIGVRCQGMAIYIVWISLKFGFFFFFFFLKVPAVLKETSDFEERALIYLGVLKYATTMSGAQFAMIFGLLLMLELLVYSWDNQVQVITSWA